MTGLNRLQVDALLRPIAGARVGKDGKGFSHVEAFDCRRRLIEIFGFGAWSGEVLDISLIFEQEIPPQDPKHKPRWTVAYRCTYRLTIHATGAVYTETATGESTNQPSRGDAHDLAVKTAESQAFKRAAVNLGSQLGLSLYAKGSLAPIVRHVLGDDPARIGPDGTIIRPEKPEHADTTDHVTEPVAPEAPAPGEGEATGYAGPSPVQDPESPVGEASKPPMTRIQAKDTHDAGEEQPGVPASPPPDPAEPMPTPQDMLNDEVTAVLAHDDWSAQKKRGALSKILLRAGQIPGVKTSLVVVGDEYVSLEARIQAAIMQVGR